MAGLILLAAVPIPRPIIRLRTAVGQLGRAETPTFSCYITTMALADYLPTFEEIRRSPAKAISDHRLALACQGGLALVGTILANWHGIPGFNGLGLVLVFIGLFCWIVMGWLGLAWLVTTSHDGSARMANQNATNNSGRTFGVPSPEAPARCELLESKFEDRAGGGKIATFRIRLTRPVSRLVVQGHAQGILALKITRPAVEGFSTSAFDEARERHRPTLIERSWSSASGEYVVTIVTAENERPRIAWDIIP